MISDEFQECRNVNMELNNWLYVMEVVFIKSSGSKVILYSLHVCTRRFLLKYRFLILHSPLS